MVVAPPVPALAPPVPTVLPPVPLVEPPVAPVRPPVALVEPPVDVIGRPWRCWTRPSRSSCLRNLLPWSHCPCHPSQARRRMTLSCRHCPRLRTRRSCSRREVPPGLVVEPPELVTPPLPELPPLAEPPLPVVAPPADTGAASGCITTPPPLLHEIEPYKPASKTNEIRDAFRIGAPRSSDYKFTPCSDSGGTVIVWLNHSSRRQKRTAPWFVWCSARGRSSDAGQSG